MRDGVICSLFLYNVVVLACRANVYHRMFSVAQGTKRHVCPDLSLQQSLLGYAGLSCKLTYQEGHHRNQTDFHVSLH